MLGRRISRGGRPGLIGTAARTAVIAGTATAVSGRVAERQMQRHAAAQASQPTPQGPSQEQAGQPDAPAPAPATQTGGAPAPLDNEAIQQIERLGTLHSQGLLTDDEFAAAKRRIIGL
jgi:uncharacterized membrane protein